MQLNVNNDVTSLLSGQRKYHKGQKSGINISIRVIVARSGLPAEIFFRFIGFVCMIVVSLNTVLFSALKLLL